MLLDDMVWYNAEDWPDDFFYTGTIICFTQDIPLFDQIGRGEFAMSFVPFRYEAAQEIYGISGSIAGKHLGNLPFPNKNSEQRIGRIGKKWLVRNWDLHFSKKLPPLSQIKLGKFNCYA
jgi:hypothetical protein